VVADGYAPVTESRELYGDQTKDFILQPAARISGRVVSADGRAPVVGAQVAVQPRAGGRDPDAEPVSTDERGEFVINSLPPGTYGVMAR
jgi:hypothetical protein